MKKILRRLTGPSLGLALASAPIFAAIPLPSLRRIPGAEKQIVREATDVAPKDGESTAIKLRDGRILLLWSEFMNTDLMAPAERPAASPLRRNPTGDDGYARISGMTSRDGGRTWTKPSVVVDDPDALINCMSPGLTRLADGRLLLAYSWRSGGNAGSNYGHCAKFVRFSRDEGLTWSDRTRITPDNSDYHTGCHDRAYTLASGRAIVQCHTLFRPDPAHPAPGAAAHMGTYFAYSDDNGSTWSRSAVLTDPLRGRFEEASLVQRADGSLLQVIRSRGGESYFSESGDDGATWSTPRPSGIVTSLAPSLLKRIPGSADLLLIWNPAWNPDEPLLGWRCPLACALSRDGGRTWGLPKALETDPNFSWEYPAVLFDGDCALVYYRCFTHDHKWCHLIQARVPLTWFYDERSS